jgi:hypothetical protein
VQALLDKSPDQLRAGSLIPDQHGTRVERLALLGHSALQLASAGALAPHLFADWPGQYPNSAEAP